MEEIRDVLRLIFQECLHRTVEEMVDVPVSQMSNVMTEVFHEIQEVHVKNMSIFLDPISERTGKQLVCGIMEETVEVVKEVYRGAGAISSWCSRWPKLAFARCSRSCWAGGVGGFHAGRLFCDKAFVRLEQVVDLPMWQVVIETLEEIKDIPQSSSHSATESLVRETLMVLMDFPWSARPSALGSRTPVCPMCTWNRSLKRSKRIHRNTVSSSTWNRFLKSPLSHWRRDRGGGANHYSGALALHCGAA